MKTVINSHDLELTRHSGLEALAEHRATLRRQFLFASGVLTGFAVVIAVVAIHFITR